MHSNLLPLPLCLHYSLLPFPPPSLVLYPYLPLTHLCHSLATSSLHLFEIHISLPPPSLSSPQSPSLTVFEEPEDPSTRSFFSEIIASISDVKFSHSGRYILSRDYLTVKVYPLELLILVTSQCREVTFTSEVQNTTI